MRKNGQVADANCSTFDLAPTSGAAFAERAIASATIEAPVGLYQAVDVGVRPTATATAEKDAAARSNAVASR